MTNSNFIRDNRIWWAVKIIAACYQVSATARVFYENLIDAGRSHLEATIDAGFAILLIDALFLAVLWFLESDEISTYDKFPLVLVGIALSVAIIAIGISDEGALAWMPRIGVIGLILTDVLRWGSAVGRDIFERRRYHQTRDYQEQQIRNDEVIARKNTVRKARKEALEKLYPEFVQVQMDRERRVLGLMDENPIKETPSVEPEYENIVLLDDGNCGWMSPDTGDLIVTTTTGKPYASERGAYLALNRANKRLDREKDAAW